MRIIGTGEEGKKYNTNGNVYFVFSFEKKRENCMFFESGKASEWKREKILLSVCLLRNAPYKKKKKKEDFLQNTTNKMQTKD